MDRFDGSDLIFGMGLTMSVQLSFAYPSNKPEHMHVEYSRCHSENRSVLYHPPNVPNVFLDY
jgi:hypothetical protein